VESGEAFAKLFGVTTLSDPSKVNLDYKYVITGVAQKLGFPTWHEARKLIKTAVDLLRKVMNGEHYELDEQPVNVPNKP
jgi:hypothetical protein